MADYETERMRTRINRSPTSELCVVQLAALATDTSYKGFEDPRAAAMAKLDQLMAQQRNGKTIYCERRDCYSDKTTLKLSEDTFDSDRACKFLKQAAGGLCLKDTWDIKDRDDDEGYETVKAGCEFVAGPGSAGYLCPQMNCTFSEGWSEDGISGTAGDCAKEKGDPIGTDLPLSEVAVRLR